MEYAILVINDGGTATQVSVTDDQSATPFTQIDTATIQMMDVGVTTNCATNTCTITQDAGGSTVAPATPATHNATDGDFGGMNGDILTIYAGTGADLSLIHI